MGTLSYMSPEACMGQATGPGHDIWSLGIILYEMLSGRRPFAAASVGEQVRAILSQPLPELPSNLPEPLTDLVYRMLVRNPARRIPSVRQVGTELEAVLERPTMLKSRYEAEPASVRPLPEPDTALVGRDQELASLEGLLERSRCITLLGPGGIGKTRPALEVARRFSTVATFVSLAQLEDADRLLSSLAEALGFSFAGERDPVEQLTDHLKGRRILLILDNFEQLRAAARTLSRLIEALPDARWLITSRFRLNLKNETLYEIRQLSGENAAVELFVAMARRTLPDYQLELEDRKGVVRICHLVKGLPLGLELAAAWVRLLSPGEIADELQRDLNLLESQAADVHERHRSLQAAFDSSWRLLEPPQQNALRDLSIFRGGFTREAATQVARCSLPILLSLVDCSLIHRQATGRFEMQAMIRQFAGQEIEASVTARHADYFSEFLSKQKLWLQRGGPEPVRPM